MSRDYTIRIPGKNFIYIKPEKVGDIWNSFPKSQCPIRYDRENKKVLLVSSNIADITNAIEIQCWEHSMTPKEVCDGWVAYIIPNHRCRKLYPEMAHGAEFEITGKPSFSDKRVKWQSELHAKKEE